MSEVIKKLQAMLKADARSSREIGDALKVLPVTIRKFQKYGRGLSVENLEALAKILGAQVVVVKKTTAK